jgi:hypothetical protein
MPTPLKYRVLERSNLGSGAVSRPRKHHLATGLLCACLFFALASPSASSLYSPCGPSGLCSTDIATRVGVGCIPSNGRASADMTASNPYARNCSTRAVAACMLILSLVGQTRTPLGTGEFVPKATGPSRIFIIANASNTSHLAVWSTEATSEAKSAASMSSALYETSAGSLANWSKCDAISDCVFGSNLRHAPLLDFDAGQVLCFCLLLQLAGFVFIDGYLQF